MAIGPLTEQLTKMVIDNFRFRDEWGIDIDCEEKTELHAENRSSLQCLRNLSLVSKDLKRLSQPLLYSRFYRDTWGSGADTKTKLFLRSLLENKQLGGLIKELSLGDWNNRNEPAEQVLPADLARLYDEALYPQFSERGDVFKELRDGVQDAEVLLLLVLCPNATSLSITVGSDMSESSRVFTFLNQQAQRNEEMDDPKILSKLERFYFEHWDTENAVGFDEVRPFLHSPHLNCLQGHMASIEDIKMKCNNVTTVKFSQSLWDSSSLAGLLQACPQLETLSLGSGGSLVGEMAYNFGAMGRTLRKHGASLRHLTIESRESYPGEFEDGDEEEDNDGGEFSTRLGSLKPLATLQSLQVPIGLLFKLTTDEDEDENSEEDDSDDGDNDDENDDEGAYDRSPRIRLSGVDCTSPEFVSELYDKVKRLLPNSLEDLELLDCLNNPSTRPARCIVCNGESSNEKLRMHICREEADIVGDGCRMPW